MPGRSLTFDFTVVCMFMHATMPEFFTPGSMGLGACLQMTTGQIHEVTPEAWAKARMQRQDSRAAA